MSAKGSPRSVKPLVLLAILGIMTYFMTNYAFSVTEAMPEEDVLSLQMISKPEAAEHAAAFAQQTWGVQVAPDQLTVLYQAHKTFAGYLQKYDLQDTFKEVFQGSLPLDYYEASARTGDGTFRVRMDMKDGRVLGWSKSFADDETSLERTSGDMGKNEDLALQYIRDQGYTAIEPVDRTDRNLPEYRHLFTIVDHTVKEAKLQIAVDVRSGAITSYMPSFVPPDSFLTWIDEQDQTVSLLSFISIMLSMLMGMSALILAIVFRSSLSFARGAVLSILYAILATISNFNMYPAFQSMGEGTAAAMLAMQEMFSLFTAGAVYVAAVSGDGLWRRHGRHLWARLSDHGFGGDIVAAMGKGYLFCFMIMGLQNLLFFVMMKGFHVWSVNDPLFSPYNLQWPYLFPLLAWAAAISEEITYRVFGIYLFRKLFRSTIVAALLSSMIWAIGHTAYPIYPAYTRFIEVTILGLVFSYVFLKHGFYTAVFAHAAMDSILMSLSILPLGGALNISMALVFIFLPVPIAFLIAWIDRFIPKRAPITNPDPLPPRSGMS